MAPKKFCFLHFLSGAAEDKAFFSFTLGLTYLSSLCDFHSAMLAAMGNSPAMY